MIRSSLFVCVLDPRGCMNSRSGCVMPANLFPPVSNAALHAVCQQYRTFPRPLHIHLHSTWCTSPCLKSTLHPRRHKRIIADRNPLSMRDPPRPWQITCRRKHGRRGVITEWVCSWRRLSYEPELGIYYSVFEWGSHSWNWTLVETTNVCGFGCASEGWLGS